MFNMLLNQGQLKFVIVFLGLLLSNCKVLDSASTPDETSSKTEELLCDGQDVPSQQKDSPAYSGEIKIRANLGEEQTKPSTSGWSKQLTERKFLMSNGYSTRFVHEEGQWLASVQLNAHEGVSRNYILPIEIESGMEPVSLLALNEKEQEELIHLVFDPASSEEQPIPMYLYIGPKVARRQEGERIRKEMQQKKEQRKLEAQKLDEITQKEQEEIRRWQEIEQEEEQLLETIRQQEEQAYQQKEAILIAELEEAEKRKQEEKEQRAPEEQRRREEARRQEGERIRKEMQQEDEQRKLEEKKLDEFKQKEQEEIRRWQEIEQQEEQLLETIRQQREQAHQEEEARLIAEFEEAEKRKQEEKEARIREEAQRQEEIRRQQEEEAKRQKEEQAIEELINSQKLEKSIAKELREVRQHVQELQARIQQGGGKEEDTEDLTAQIQAAIERQEYLEDLEEFFPVQEKTVEELEAELMEEIRQSIEEELAKMNYYS